MVTDETDTHFEGRISWRSFLKEHSRLFFVLTISLVISICSLYFNPRKFIIPNCFSAFVATSSLLHLGIWLSSLVTWFQVEGEELRYCRFGRRARTARLTDAITIDEQTSSSAGASVWLNGGTTLYISCKSLSNADKLIRTFRPPGSRAGVIEGSVNFGGVARTLVYQWQTTCFLLTISAVACLCLAVFVAPQHLVANVSLFLLLGSTLLMLCALGFYFSALDFWLGCVHSFRWDGDVLRYRTAFFRALRERFGDEIEDVSAQRRSSSRGEAGTWRSIRFRDGTRIKLHVGILENADALYSCLKTHVEQRRMSLASEQMLPPVIPEILPWHLIQSHLEKRERVLWVGRPVYCKLWSEMSAEVIFGFIPGTFGIVLIVLAWTIGGNDGGSIFVMFIGILFTGIGLHLIAAPWRYYRMLRHAVYVVTSQRVIIVNGITWGSQSTVQVSKAPVEIFDRNQAVLFEVVGRRRDLILGGNWTRGRKGRQFRLHTGFLAVDDPVAAEIAIRCMLSNKEFSSVTMQ